MATIKKRGNTYKITVSHGYGADGKQIRHSATFAPDPDRTDRQNQKALNEFVVDFERKVKSGKYATAGKMTLADFYALFMSEHARKQYENATIERTENAFAKLLPKIGHIRLVELLPLHISACYTDIEKEGYTRNGKRHDYHPNTIKRMDSSLRSALQTAVDWGLIEANPCEKVKPPKVRKDKSKIKHLTTAQTKALLGFLDMPYTVTWRGRKRKDGSPSSEHTETRTVPLQLKALFSLAVFGGLRRQEICALRWSDLDLAKGIVDITRAAERVKGGVSDKAPKNESSARPVSLPPSVVALLKAHRKSQFEYRLSIGSKWQGADFVFARTDGQRIGITTATRELHRIIERYNATTDGGPLPLVGLHGLRHTHSTLLIAAGVDVRTVSGRLGHADTSTTLDIYSHFLKESDAKAAAVLEEILNTKHA